MPRARRAVEAPAPAGGRSLSIPRDARGHFQTDARIDGQRIDFMVDTGASVVALNEKSAARFGLRPSRSDYNATVTTANGTIKAARTRIAMMDVGGLIEKNHVHNILEKLGVTRRRDVVGFVVGSPAALAVQPTAQEPTTTAIGPSSV